MMFLVSYALLLDHRQKWCNWTTEGDLLILIRRCILACSSSPSLKTPPTFRHENSAEWDKSVLLHKWELWLISGKPPLPLPSSDKTPNSDKFSASQIQTVGGRSPCIFVPTVYMCLCYRQINTHKDRTFSVAFIIFNVLTNRTQHKRLSILRTF